MPKINVYLPDDLADAVRDTGVPVSAICQRALEQAVRRMTMIRSAVLGDVDTESPAGRLPHVTPRAVEALRLAVADARAAGTPNVGTGPLLRGIIAEGGNLALQILAALEIDPAAVAVGAAGEPGGDGGGLRFSTSAGNALELSVSEAIAMGHNYVGCEHLLIGLAAEPDGNAGKALRAAGADLKTVRRAVATAIAGYAHLRAATASPPGATGILTAVRAQLQPLIERIERLEERLK
jgi:Clp amino terminal domain, pathogenicity island component